MNRKEEERGGKWEPESAKKKTAKPWAEEVRKQTMFILQNDWRELQELKPHLFYLVTHLVVVPT